MELGRFNVFIGENGSGKSNVLESIAFLSAYLNHKLDNEYLSSRGIRNTEPKFFKSLFDKENIKSPISFECTINGKKVVEVRLDFDENIEKWGNVKFKKLNVTTDDIKKILSGEKKIEPIEFENKLEELFYTILSKGQEVFTIQDENKKKTAIDKYSSVLEDINVMLEENRKEINIFLDNFLLFSPENSSLRNFADEGQILPLGIKVTDFLRKSKDFLKKK
ncbi:MAG: AAA family ATPase [Bacteroidota bacterium]